MLRKTLSCLFILAAAACASPGPSLYLLDAPEVAERPIDERQAAVGLREIALPLYARRVQISSVDEAGALSASDDNRWAEEPQHAATRLMARRLTKLRGAPAYAEPWPQAAAPAVIVSIDVDRFLGVQGGEVTLEGQMTLVRASSRDRPELRLFNIKTPVNGVGYDALTAAYGEAIAALTDQLAAELARF